MIATCAISAYLAGTLAFARGLLTGKEVGLDEVIAHLLAFLCIWLIFICTIKYTIDWIRGAEATLN